MLVYGLFIALGNGGKWAVKMICLLYTSNERNVIDARVPSILISGGGNFPVAKKHKQNAARERKYGEYAEISKLLDKIRSVGTVSYTHLDVYKRQQLLRGIHRGSDCHIQRMEFISQLL